MQTLIAQSTSSCNPGQGGINLGDCLRLSDSTKVSDKYDSIGFLVNLVVRNLFLVAGIVLFIMILLAGFNYVTKGKEGVENAKKIAGASLMGFLLMFAAYWIVQLIQFVTGANIIL